METLSIATDPSTMALLDSDEHCATGGGDSSSHSHCDSSDQNELTLQQKLAENYNNNYSGKEPQTTPTHGRLVPAKVTKNEEAVCFNLNYTEETRDGTDSEASAAVYTRVTRPLSEVSPGNSRLCMGRLSTTNPSHPANDDYRPASPDTFQPIDAVQHNECSFMVLSGMSTAPSSTPTPHPDDIVQNLHRMSDRGNHQTVRDVAAAISGRGSRQISGAPNNDNTIGNSDLPPNNDHETNRQLSTTSEEDGG